MSKFLHVLLAFALLPFSSTRAETSFERECAAVARSKGSAHDRLWKLFDVHWRYSMTEYPEWATYVGYPGQNARLTDLSLATIARRKGENGAALKALASISRARLSATDQSHYDIFKYEAETYVAGDAFPGELLPISQLNGIHQDFASLLESAPRAKLADFQDRLTRLKLGAQQVAQVIALLEEGLRRGITPPKITLRDVPDQVKALEESDPAKNPLLESFRTEGSWPESIPANERARLFRETSAIVAQELIPAFRKLREFLTTRYLPAARETIAWTALPEGPAWYAHLVRQQTTTQLSPDEIHEIGLKEVARIRGEMDKVIASTGFKGDFAKFSRFLRTDKRFYFDRAEDLLAAYRDIAKRVDPELPRLFGKLPRLTYGIKPVPAYSEKSQTTAYYMGGSLESGRAGNFYANTYDLKTRPKWEMEALTLHEAVPGHHFQIALAQEMSEAPEFRKNGGFTAYVEGWGLYAESLGEELGFYKDPYAKFGQLTYEIWRAIRLVVDTGVHAKGWTREKAIDFFKSNSSKTEHDITVEVDRYIVWAGQALAYKTGELRFKALKARAQGELGAKFDIREFHDTVLGQGALPLDVLEANVVKWMAAKKK